MVTYQNKAIDDRFINEFLTATRLPEALTRRERNREIQFNKLYRKYRTHARVLSRTLALQKSK